MTQLPERASDDTKFVGMGLYSPICAQLMLWLQEFANRATAKWARYMSNLYFAVEPDGEIVLVKKGNTWRRTLIEKKKTQTEVRGHIGWMLKEFTIMLAKKQTGMSMSALESPCAFDKRCRKIWNRGNMLAIDFESTAVARAFPTHDGTDVFPALKGITVSDLYAIYEVLQNRGEKAVKRYEAARVAELIGTKRDPIQTEMEVARRAEIIKITRDYDKMIRNCQIDTYNFRYGEDGLNEATKELRTFYVQLKAKWEKKAAELAEEKKAKLEELDQMLNAATLMGI